MPELPDRPDPRRSVLDRWSFGGAAAIETPSGLLLPEGLVGGVDDAVLFTRLTPRENGAWPEPETPADRIRGIDEQIRELEASARTGDVAVVDDRGATYALSVRELSGAHGPFPRLIRFRVDPPPGRGIEWIELRGQNATAARLLPSPRAAARIGPLTPVTARPPTGQRPDGGLPPVRPRHHLDLGITLPPIDGVTLRLDSLISAPGGWSLHLRATPQWWRYRDDRRRKRSPVAISAEDDRGGSYVHSFGGSAGRDGYHELSLRFSPRLDPLARRLRLTFAGSIEQIDLDLDLDDLPGPQAAAGAPGAQDAPAHAASRSSEAWSMSVVVDWARLSLPAGASGGSPVQSYVWVTSVRDSSSGSISQRHTCPAGSCPASPGIHAISRPSSNSITRLSRTPLVRVSVIANTSPTPRTRCPGSAMARLSFPSQLGCSAGSAISSKIVPAPAAISRLALSTRTSVP